MKKRIVFVSNVDSAYANSGVEYLSNALVTEGHEVELITPHSLACHRALEQRNRARLHMTIPDGLLGSRRIRWLAHYLETRRLLRALCPYDITIFTNYLFIGNARLAKKINKSVRLIHYALEYYGPSDRWPMPYLRQRKAYKDSIPLFDLHIDVEKHRAELRKLYYGLATEPLVLPNTLPLKYAAETKPEIRLEELTKFERKKDVPVLIYTGGNGKAYGIEMILEALANIHRPFLFIGLMYEGERTNVQVLELAKQRIGEDRVRIAGPFPREIIRTVIGQADCAIGYYDAEKSANFRYCAPTKVYEYIASGLPCVFSWNPSMVDLIEKNGLGQCAADTSNEALRRAIEGLLFDKARLATIREKTKKVFTEKLCFEKSSVSIIKAIEGI